MQASNHKSVTDFEKTTLGRITGFKTNKDIDALNDELLTLAKFQFLKESGHLTICADEIYIRGTIQPPHPNVGMPQFTPIEQLPQVKFGENTMRDINGRAAVLRAYF